MAWEKGDLLTQNNNLYLITEQRTAKNHIGDTWVELDYDWLTLHNLSNDEVIVNNQTTLEYRGFYVIA